MSRAHIMLPEYAPRERLIDGAVHGLGIVAAVIAVGMLLRLVIPAGDTRSIVAATIYATGLLAMLGLSAAYNLIPRPPWRESIRRYDHAAIFVMIAGTYTPFALVSIGGRLGEHFLALVWLIAIIGVLVKVLRPRRFERAAIILYLALGWIGLPLVGALVEALPGSAPLLIGVGGVLYSAGIIFHLWHALPHHNALWHGFVLAGAGCHYAAVLDALTAS